MKKIIIWGADSMIGSYIAKYFSDQVTYLVTRGNFDSLHCTKESVVKLLETFVNNQPIFLKGAYMINCERITNRDHVDKDEMIRINSILPGILNQACVELGIKMIHLSTNCVYSGLKGNYSEVDKPDPTDLYGMTRYLGEPDCMVIRASIIGEGEKTNLLEWVRQFPGDAIHGYSQVMWNGVTALEMCLEIAGIMENWFKYPNLLHIHGPTVSKCKLVSAIVKSYQIKTAVIHDKSKQEFKTLSSQYFDSSQYHDDIIHRINLLKDWKA